MAIRPYADNPVDPPWSPHFCSERKMEGEKAEELSRPNDQVN